MNNSYSIIIHCTCICYKPNSYTILVKIHVHCMCTYTNDLLKLLQTIAIVYCNYMNSFNTTTKQYPSLYWVVKYTDVICVFQEFTYSKSIATLIL